MPQVVKESGGFVGNDLLALQVAGGNALFLGDGWFGVLLARIVARALLRLLGAAVIVFVLFALAAAVLALFILFIVLAILILIRIIIIAILAIILFVLFILLTINLVLL